MTLQEFVDYWTGKQLIFTGVYGIQCMSVPHQYLYDVLNLTDATLLAQPSAYELFTNFPNYPGAQYFTRVENTPDNMPPVGAIMIWGTHVGPNGHVAVAVKDISVTSFTSFDENWPEGSLPHLQVHDYTGVLGWLVPIPQQPQVDVAQITDDLNKCIQNEKLLTDQHTQDLQEKTQLKTDLKALQLERDTLKSENDALINENATITTDRKNYNDEANLAKSQAAQLTEYLDTIAAHAGVEFRGQTDDKITASIMLVLSQQAQEISDLQNQLKRYNDIKQAIDPVMKTPLWKKIASIFYT